MNQEIPREAIHAYNLYIHGEIDRRAFFDRVKKVAVSTAAAGARRSRLWAREAAMFFWLKPSEAETKTAISSTLAASAASRPLMLGTSAG